MPTVYEPQRPPVRTPTPTPTGRRDYRNVGGGEQGGRIVLGVVLLLIGYAITGWGRDLLYALGAISLFTAFAGYCPVNAMLGRNSCRMERADRGTFDPDERL